LESDKGLEPDTTPHYFTIGYSGRNLSEFVKVLKRAGVVTLVDIRYNAISMYKRDFTGRNLEPALKRHGIEYLHLRNLGVPSDIRGKAAAEDNIGLIWEWYDYNVARAASRNLDWFFNSANHPVAFMCVETKPADCHRHRLSLALEQHGLRGCDL
jgi:uncharacterized protein (DUF488 family)